MVDSIPPSYTGGNIDNWRIGKGATLYYPVAVPGALFSVGDPHASQGDSELCGTAIECSLTGTFQLILHKKASSRARRWRTSTIRCWRRKPISCCTASAFPTTLRISAEGAVGDLQQILRRPGTARRFPQDAPLPHDHPGSDAKTRQYR